MLPCPPEQLTVLTVIVALGGSVQTSIGFWAMLISVTLGSMLLPVGEVVTLLLPLSVAQAAVVAVQERAAIVWRLLLRQVLPPMAAGMGLSVLLFDADEPWMRPALGLLILGLALRELVGSNEPRPATRARHVLSALGIAAAEVVQGLFATGGPLLVWSLGQQRLAKGAFRATLVVVWLTLNTVLYGSFLVKGRADAAIAPTSVLLLPGAIVGIAAGHWLHDRVDERRFRRVLWSALVVASIALIAR